MSSLHASYCFPLATNWNRSYTVLSSERLTDASSKHGKRSTNGYDMRGNRSLQGAARIRALASIRRFYHVDTAIAILVAPGSDIRRTHVLAIFLAGTTQGTQDTGRAKFPVVGVGGAR
jgi:hypothetical protein